MTASLITRDPGIMMGKPVISGTRITVEHILRELGAGTAIEELVDMHPHLTRGEILEALRYPPAVKRRTMRLPGDLPESNL
jgi:uncharacterized protein (DUF433 family)